jgi:hypothetical protein
MLSIHFGTKVCLSDTQEEFNAFARLQHTLFRNFGCVEAHGDYTMPPQLQPTFPFPHSSNADSKIYSFLLQLYRLNDSPCGRRSLFPIALNLPLTGFGVELSCQSKCDGTQPTTRRT